MPCTYWRPTHTAPDCVSTGWNWKATMVEPGRCCEGGDEKPRAGVCDPAWGTGNTAWATADASAFSSTRKHTRQEPWARNATSWLVLQGGRGCVAPAGGGGACQAGAGGRRSPVRWEQGQHAAEGAQQYNHPLVHARLLPRRLLPRAERGVRRGPPQAHRARAHILRGRRGGRVGCRGGTCGGTEGRSEVGREPGRDATRRHLQNPALEDHLVNDVGMLPLALQQDLGEAGRRRVGLSAGGHGKPRALRVAREARRGHPRHAP